MTVKGTVTPHDPHTSYGAVRSAAHTGGGSIVGSVAGQAPCSYAAVSSG